MVRRILLIMILLLLSASSSTAKAQKDSVFVLQPEHLNENGVLRLPAVTQWKYHKGNDPRWADPDLDDHNWALLDSTSITALDYDVNGLFEGWFRFRFRFEPGFEEQPYFIFSGNGASTELYLDGQRVAVFGDTGRDSGTYRRNRGNIEYLSLHPGQEYLLAVYFRDEIGPLTLLLDRPKVMGTFSFLYLVTDKFKDARLDAINNYKLIFSVLLGILSIFALLFWLIWGLNRGETHLLFIAVFATFLTWLVLNLLLPYLQSGLFFMNAEWRGFRNISGGLGAAGTIVTMTLALAAIFMGTIPRWIRWLCGIVLLGLCPTWILFNNTSVLVSRGIPVAASLLILAAGSIIIFKSWKSIKGAKWTVAAGLIVTIISFVIPQIFGLFGLLPESGVPRIFLFIQLLAFPTSLLFYVAIWFKETLQSEQKKAIELVRMTREKEEILKEQNVRLEEEVKNRTADLNHSLESLKATQTQLIHSEKMASLGELTAGIAHEIQNPLNFVNNFSQVSRELLEELLDEMKKGDAEEVDAIARDVMENLEKINHHGQRADSIVKSMLQHSRSGNGKKEPTDLNALADEYLRLAYHGMRARDKSFNANLDTDFDPELPKVSVVPQDIGRVLLNLLTNAFHAVNERNGQESGSYQPTVRVSTRKTGDGVEISVRDNGGGIPDKIRGKIFQPFFTTKPTGEGTGLGLSMSYDIITKGHGGQLKVKSKEGEGSEFCINLTL